MSSMRLRDWFSLIYRILEYKYEQRKLTTSIYTTVKTQKGAIKGVKRLSDWGDAYHSFEKIPYAKPPIGELRFRAPVPAEPWTTVLDCTGPAEKPIQSNMIFRKYKGSEDCLYLNVFTKDLTPEKLRPVMVWIYGGGFQIGEATRDMYSPDFFMSKDVVLVTIAYRLGPFGFLSIDDPAVNVPGNAGIKDQILSLKWVQENISAFGGDPNNVTLFGESAGGASTHLCLLSEQSRNLVHKAIIMSGSALCPWANPPRNNWALRLAQQLGYDGDEGKDVEIYKYLLNAKGPDMVSAAGLVLKKEEKHYRTLFAFGPTVEPYITSQCVIAEKPYELMKKTWSNQIPIMIGGTSFEGLLFYQEVTRRPATLSEVNGCKNVLPGDIDFTNNEAKAEEFGQRLKSAYFGDADCNANTKMEFLELESYREFWHPIYRTALARQLHSTAPTYVYRFDYDSKSGNGVRNILCGPDSRGACHGDDLCYIWRTMICNRLVKNTPEYEVARSMIDIWTSFATNGDPNGETLENVIFEPLTRDENMKCLNISEKMEFIDLPELEKLKVWNSFYPQGKL
ncbi:esterase B1-like [Teleopsis dalmanni]|uniref:esterase B1-like n=1 Tax=Teleopsis dalmanni TaxID=139649 RepID=UPI0018CF9448|nr:esterase B1-like [Teleopsis dalmanni]XP_037945475.1 esterase B1-like [Teleopsis dalmanni]